MSVKPTVKLSEVDQHFKIIDAELERLRCLNETIKATRDDWSAKLLQAEGYLSRLNFSKGAEVSDKSGNLPISGTLSYLPYNRNNDEEQIDGIVLMNDVDRPGTDKQISNFSPEEIVFAVNVLPRLLFALYAVNSRDADIFKIKEDREINYRERGSS